MVERLGREFARGRDASRLRFGDVDAAGILDQRVEAPAPGPGSRMPVGRERDGNNAGTHLGAGLGRKAEGGERAGTVTLDKDVSLPQQLREAIPVVQRAQIK